MDLMAAAIRSSCSNCKDMRDPFNQAYSRGMHRIAAHDYMGATKFFRAAISIRPVDPIGHAGLATALRLAGQRKLATAEYVLVTTLFEAQLGSVDHILSLIQQGDASGKMWAQAAVLAYHGLVLQICADLDKPAWFTSPMTLVRVAQAAVNARAESENAVHMLADALRESEPTRAAECYRRAAHLTKSEHDRGLFLHNAMVADSVAEGATLDM
uniref:Uncharacterized protein n=1 Tax=Haptolina ericina TaxID=156174 RepID=A0A7S3BVI0_9EUKA